MLSRSLRILSLALLLGLSSAATTTLSAQNAPKPAGVQPARPDSQFPDFAALAGNMAPMMAQMLAAQLTATLEFYARPETATKLAQFSRQYYLALVQQGFTPAEALQIVAGARVLPSTPARQ